VKTIITARYEDLIRMMRENEVFWDIKPRRMVTVTGVAEQHSVFTLVSVYMLTTPRNN